MAKIYGLFGSMTGKLADTVMSVRNGEQLARKYQPVVYNPSTPAQVAQRAKLKLVSQLSAVMAPVIAIPRQGTISARNLFTKVNFPLLSYADNTAQVTLANVQLTKSVVAFPGISVTAGDPGTINLMTSSPAAIDFNRVVYCVFFKQEDDTLRFNTSIVVNDSESSSRFETSTGTTGEPMLILAYGIRDNNENARVMFGNMVAPTAQDIAKLVANRTLTESDITFSETKGVEYTPSRGGDDPDEDKKLNKKK